MNLRSVFQLLALLVVHVLSAQENCTNGIDDDADGLIDLNDTTDCVCGLTPVQLDSILPNPSFEENECIPTSYSQMECASIWRSGTFSTADYFRTDGYMPAFIPQPLPGDGSGCVGGYFCHDYMEYIGGCLVQPLEAGSSYSLSMSIAAFEVDNLLNTTTSMDLSPVNVTIYGQSTCPTWPANVSLCPGNEGWTELGYATCMPSNTWGNITITIVPTFDVQAIMIGSPCTLPPDYPNVTDPWLAYFLIDELSISTAGSLGAPVTSEGNWCAGDLELTAHPDSTITGYQWYHDGIAIIGASDTVLAISGLSLDSGSYMFRAIGDTSCSVTTYQVATEIEPTPYIALTVDGLWCPLIGSYQWFLNDEALPGATDAYYLPAQDGIYTVELTNAQGCSTLSYPFDWNSTAIGNSSGNENSLYLSFDDATLRVRNAPGRSVLTVTDASGRAVISTELIGSDHYVSFANTAHGMYTARINDRLFRFVR